MFITKHITPNKPNIRQAFFLNLVCHLYMYATYVGLY
jgi:hypothetical protein